MLTSNFTNLFTQWFDKPKVSIFNLSKPVSTDVQIGKFYPTYWTICGFGDSEKGSCTHKMRLMPMLAPNFADLKFEEQAVVVPLRVIMRDYEARFNYAKNRDGAQLPTINISELIDVYKAMGKVGLSPIGSLFDFLGLPVFADVYKSIVSTPSTYLYTMDSESVKHDLFYIDINPLTVFTQSRYIGGYFFYRLTPDSSSGSYEVPEDTIYNFFFYHLSRLNSVDLGLDIMNDGLTQWIYFLNSLSADYLSSTDPLSIFARFMNSTVVELTNQYYSYLFTSLLPEVINSYSEETKSYSILPLLAYHRVVADWSLVSNVTDPDTYLQNYVYDFKTNLLELATRLIATGDDVDELTQDELKFFEELVSPKDRLWDLDFFTSMLPTSAQGEDITIPANSTIIDLASLTAFQKFVMKLSFNSRYRDVVWNLFNIRPSDARLQQSSVIQNNTHFVQIGETIQTSETTVSSVLGSFGGRGFSAGTKKGYHIFCEEPCIVMNFSSLVAKPRYMDSLHPLIHVDDIFDFPIPDMDVLGNQPFPTDILTGNPEDGSVFGYARQYMEWLGNYGTVHNNMKTSLDYWTLGRRFDSMPALNEEFLTINPKDDFDRIFSVPDSSHAALDLYYDIKVTRPVHRSVRILI